MVYIIIKEECDNIAIDNIILQCSIVCLKQSDAKVTGKGQTVGDAWDDVWRIHQ